MCEWLSQAEWCDVQLLCRGRVFSAHRAVLASVSAFLRKILLSCNEESSPTLIVLPDFELDSMFSVLYYIYNGEVYIPPSSLEAFLDIITTLEIFVDRSFLSKVQGFDNQLQKINTYNKEVVERLTYSRSIFKLKSDYNDNVYVTIKKGYAHAQVTVQEPLDVVDTAAYCNQTQQPRLYLENIHSQHGHRQKKSFLRDSFIETYPRNGNVNGLTVGVPAILNEHYLHTTSALLMNANSKDPVPAAANADLSQIDEQTPDKQNFTIYLAEKLPYNFVDDLNNKRYVPHRLDSKSDKPIPSEVPAVFEEQILTRKMSAFLDLRVGQTVDNALTEFQTRNYVYPYNLRRDLQQNFLLNGKCNGPGSFSTKTTIYNQVMQSPWSPRLPISYRPFRRKAHKVTEIRECAVDDNTHDRNNNIDSSLEIPVKSNDEINLSNEAETQSNFQQVTASSNIDLKCNVCDQVFPDSGTLASHVKSHSARFTCLECHKTFSQLRNFKYHMSVHRGTREFAATCSVCGKYFNDRGYLSSHMKIHRNRKEYKCHLCPKSFNQRVAYNMHVRIHTGIKPHVCDECGKAFSRKMLLKQHQRTHSGERPYACPHCDKRFADRSNMTLHLRLHTGVKPFSCTLCPKSFTKKHHLKSHLNYHTGAKPYSCPRCHLAFTQSSNMRTHLKKCNASTSNVSSS